MTFPPYAVSLYASSICLRFSRFQCLQPLHRNIHPSQRRMRSARIPFSVPIRPSGNHEVELARQFGESRFHMARMTGMAYFDAVEPVGLQRLELRLLPAIAQMCGEYEAAAPVHQVRDFAQRGQGLSVEGWAAAPEKPVE